MTPLALFGGSNTKMVRPTRGPRRDFCWNFTPIIVEWERGDFEDELVEVSHEQASKIIEYFRGRWGASGGA